MKLGNYILEQEISTASCDDIEIAQLYAEMEVVSALLDCYNKQAVIAEYASCDVSEFGIFAESEQLALPMNGESNDSEDSVDSKKDNIAKRAINAIIGMFKKIGQMIVKLFSSVRYSDIAKTIIESDVQQYSLPKELDQKIKAIGEVMDTYNLFVQLIEEESIEASKYESISKTVAGTKARLEKYSDGDEVNYSKEKVLEKLKKLQEYQENEIPKVRKMLKTLGVRRADFEGKIMKKGLYPVIKTASKDLYETFTKLQSSIMKMTSKLVKAQTKGQRKITNEYYTDDVVQEGAVADIAITLAPSVVGIAAEIIAGIVIVKKLKGAPMKFLDGVTEIMNIVNGGGDKIKRNLKEFNRALRKTKSALNWSRSSIATLTVRENKELNKITKDLNEYIDAVLVMTEGLFAKRNIDKDTYRISDRIKELVEECQKVVDFFKDHPIHGEKKDNE